MSALKYVEILPSSGGIAKNLMIMAHGYGSNGENLSDLAKFLSPLFPDMIFPVSYTHLDVYKRQQVDFVRLSDGKKTKWRAIIVYDFTFSHIDVKKPRTAIPFKVTDYSVRRLER